MPDIMPDGWIDITDDIEQVDAEFPKLLKTDSPMLLRSDRFSITVDSTTFFAKVRYGELFKGYMIYSTGIQTPIYEYNDKTIEQDDMDETHIKEMEKKAENWLNDLSNEILTKQSTNPIKEAIDRMCWQMHYDITQSDTDFVEVFADQGFSDTIGIDYKQIGSAVPTNCYPAAYLYPVRETAMDSAHEITGQSGSGGGYGSLYDISAKIGTLDSNMNVGSGTLVTLNTNMVTLNGNIKGSGDTYTVCGAMTKIATNLRETNDEYTISKALRDNSSEESVSGQLKLQTTEITNGLGSSGAINTSLTSIGTTTSDIKTSTSNINRSVGSIGDTANGSLVAYVTRVDSNISTIKTDAGTINTNVGTINTNTGTINTNIGTVVTKIGSGTGTSATVLGALDRIKYTLGGDLSTTMWTNISNINSDISDISSYLDMSKVSISGGYTALMVANYPQS